MGCIFKRAKGGVREKFGKKPNSLKPAFGYAVSVIWSVVPRFVAFGLMPRGAWVGGVEGVGGRLRRRFVGVAFSAPRLRLVAGLKIFCRFTALK